ncbi:hypothetical protein M422DRAFT_259468 [Sphaerobolus stellatus SS14]|uniref:Ubiquitin-like protease family profile domain-containing protein n=1 Tax=Sphaerobolus stellatus (strain SS14) TaxID=990650 RepID=A0A0C9USR4_SPHS4|nr:hypothetical protein M422DRAFT_259468 [Sphaerobolus stellatus SS14]
MRPKSLHRIPCNPQDNFTVVLTALQQDSTSCGFWAVITGFASLMRVSVHCYELRSLGLIGVKKLLAKLWISFLSDEGGLHAEVLSTVYQTMNPSGLWDSVLVAPRPDSIPQIKIMPLSLNASSYQDVCDRISHMSLTETSFFGSFQIQGPQLQELINPMSRLSGSFISGYLSLYTKDIAASQELPGLPLPIYIMDVSRTALMSSQLTSGIFKPKLHTKTSSLWVETNIFESQMVLLPWRINRTKHWILIFLQMKEMRITVADSLTHSIQRHHRYICKRVVKFLEYEHDARGLGELPFEWEKKLQVVELPNLVYTPQASPPPPPVLLIPISQIYSEVPASGVELRMHSGNIKWHCSASPNNPMRNEGIYRFEPTQERDSIAPSLDSTPSTGSLIRSPGSAINSSLSITVSLQSIGAIHQSKKRNRTYSGDRSPPSYQLRSRKFQG